MLTASPHLRTRRPSPTTVEYTLSTRPHPGIATTLLYTLVFLVRVIFFSAALLLPSTRLLQSALLPAVLRDFFTSTELGASVLRASANLSTPVLVVVAAALAFSSVRRIYTTESVLVLRGLGIQTRPSEGGAARFIPTELIRDVLVNEVFVGFGVRYCLVVVVEGEEDMVVLFPKLKPRKDVVLKVWRGIRTCLFDGEGDVVVNGKV
ncbi:hypothetical protein jhhlp_004368 [Lomentospora prolificans]|uniref:Phosphatidylinositol N-acetylglucosaminyltransferase subunit H conserved domain-containing protein n=1 Tax=Lomentospora prolificans TaxID=41688 RepID=A0A2N3NBH9_9PEZI|nr:hypothetical protein jhhlp_004368 [Lomentospora prolificans]